MASYNEIDGVPSHANHWLLRDVLRKEWGFKGFVVSDYYAIWELSYRPDTHGHFVAKDKKEAVRAGGARRASTSSCPSRIATCTSSNWCAKACSRNRSSTNWSRRCCFWKFQLGLFDDPYVDPDEAERVVGCEAHRELALQAARETITLLKNEGQPVPLDLEQDQDHRGHRPQCRPQLARRLQRRAEARRHRARRHPGARSATA